MALDLLELQLQAVHFEQPHAKYWELTPSLLREQQALLTAKLTLQLLLTHFESLT